MQGPALPARSADVTNKAGATTVNEALLAMGMVMEDKNYSAWVASEKRDAIFYSFGWFLLVNLLVSLFLFFHRFRSTDYDSSADFMQNAPAIVAVSLVSALAYLILKLLTPHSKRGAWWVLVGCVALLALLWCVVFDHLIDLNAVNLIYPLTVALMFSALIPFYLSPMLLFLFSVPILSMVIGENIVIRGAFSLVNLASYALILILLYSAKRMLEKWFMLAMERERENRRLIERLSKLAHRDPLTGLSNRRYFNAYFDSVFVRESSGVEHFSVILIDVDYFKKYNDHYGHQAGDECLVRLAECFLRCVRRSQDLVARYGGEEFIILLPKADLHEAVAVAERIKTQVAALQIPHAQSGVSPWVSVSQGIAQWRPGVDKQRLIASADRALYQAKSQGRSSYQVADS